MSREAAKRWGIAVVFFVGMIVITFGVWIIGPIVSEKLYQYSLGVFGCLNENVQAVECDRVYARIGQTGDAFSALSSVFSGLALISVALTIWADRQSRRKALKPMVIVEVSENIGIRFDEPNFSDPQAIRMLTRFDVSTVGETALNISVKSWVTCGDWSTSHSIKSIPKPQSPSSRACEVDFPIRLDRTAIEKIIASSGDRIELNCECKFVNLEGIEWRSGVAFSVSFKEPDLRKIRAILYDSPDGRKLWDNKAVASAEFRVKDGSWFHRES